MMIIPSGKPKIWDKYPEFGAVPAKEAYTGILHKLCQAYAEKFAEEWLILSPRYGFLKPCDLVAGPYDVRFTLKGTNESTVQIEELKKEWQEKGAAPFEPVIILGGKKFAPLLSTVTEQKNPLLMPLSGSRGIGEMQGKLKQAIQSGRPLSDSTD
ncbi:DUF6884 domain-containing protein [Listeria aquatica]|uniref:DUF6884 domain-containing protein n=1 Tax=Listeria aquatica TaxID=1494960 RepID=UPI003F70A989